MVNDPVSFINQSAENCRAMYVRFGYRRPGTSKWWYYPVGVCTIRISELPPLPEAGDYRVVFYDEKMCLLPSDEIAIRIPLAAIAQTCNLTSGSRAVKSWS